MKIIWMGHWKSLMKPRFVFLKYGLFGSPKFCDIAYSVCSCLTKKNTYLLVFQDLLRIALIRHVKCINSQTSFRNVNSSFIPKGYLQLIFPHCHTACEQLPQILLFILTQEGHPAQPMNNGTAEPWCCQIPVSHSPTFRKWSMLVSALHLSISVSFTVAIPARLTGRHYSYLSTDRYPCQRVQIPQQSSNHC